MEDTKTVIMLRHAESQKNRLKLFSPNVASDALTPTGLEQIYAIKDEMQSLVQTIGQHSCAVVSSPTPRSLQTAALLFPGCAAEGYDALASIRSPHAGKSETHVASADPAFSNGVGEYRMGLRNAYDIPRGEGEAVATFERRTIDALTAIVGTADSLNILVAHRSTITALLIYAARLLNGYPRGWYGHIPVPYVTPYILTFSSSGELMSLQAPRGND